MPGTGTYLTLWSSLVAIYLIAPCLFSRNQRQRWYLRFTLRRWHVEHLLTMHTSQSLLPDEEEERLRNEFLAKKLENFTMIVGPEMIQEKYGMDQDVSTNNDHDNASMNFLKVKLGNDDSVAPAEIKKDEDDNADDTRLNTIDDAEAKQNVPPGPSALVDYSEANYDGILCNVPLAGDKKEEHKSNVLDVEDRTKQPHQSTRNVTNSCPICLSRFEDGEQLCWSGNPECLHVFHRDCIMDWLQTSGRKKLKRFRREQGDISRRALIRQVTSFAMDCPCCRQCFVIQDDDGEEHPEKDSEDVDVRGDVHAMDEELGEANQAHPGPSAVTATSSEEASERTEVQAGA